MNDPDYPRSFHFNDNGVRRGSRENGRYLTRDLSSRDLSQRSVIPASTAASASDAQSAELDPRSLGEYGSMLWRQKWLILLMFFGGGFLGLTLVLLQSEKYTSAVTLEVQGVNENFMNMRQADVQADSSSATDLNIQTQLLILRSKTLEAETVSRVRRQATPLASSRTNWLARIRHRTKPGGGDPLRAMEEAIEDARLSLRPNVFKSTRIIEVRCDSTDPNIAALYVNSLAEAYMDQSLDARLRSSQRTSDWLTRQLEETKAKLGKAEKALRTFERSTGLLGGPVEDTLTRGKVKELKEQLAAIQAERIATQTRWDTVRKVSPEALPEILNDQEISRYRAQLNDLRREVADLTTTLTPAHFKVQRITAQIAEVEGTLKRYQDAAYNRIRGEYETALAREKRLSSEYLAQTRFLSLETEKSAEYDILKRDVDTTQQLYNSLLGQVNTTNLSGAIPTSYVRVLDAAAPEPFPYRPNPIAFCALGLATGLIFGLVTAVVRGSSDRTVRSPGMLPGYLRVPELAVIPSITGKVDKPDRKRVLDLNAAPEAPLSGGSGELTAWQSRPHAESFRDALASLLTLSQRAGHISRLVITSPGPGEGKTTIASNIAIAMAESGRQVVLIDMDLRKPRLHEVFGIENGRGLGDIYLESTDISQYSLEELVRPTRLPGLSIITAGTPVSNIMQLLYSNRISQIFDRLGLAFDAVLIDTPPVLQFPDARILADLADGVMLVTRAGVTDREAVIEARVRFEQSDTPLIGTILNDCDQPAFKPYKSKYYDRRGYSAT